MSYPIIDFKSKTFKEDLIKNTREFGLCVIKNVVPIDECNKDMDKIVSAFENLGTGLKRDKVSTWTDYNTPPQIRRGMYQCMMGNLPVVWKQRVRPEIQSIFKILYQEFRKDIKDSDDLVTSIDGINVKPGELEPFYDPKNDHDWAHLDQTFYKEIYKCFQGQLVLTPTTASFRATPKSHIHHKEIVDYYYKTGSEKNFFKFSKKQSNEIRDWLNYDKGVKDWQIPIYAPQGSFIIWTSTTIHSAKMADYPEKPKPDSPWNGWRGVIYISYRPKSEIEDGYLDEKKWCIRHNRLLNHWGNCIFNKYPSKKQRDEEAKHPQIKKLADNPYLVYKQLKINYKDLLNDPKIRKAIALENED